MEGAVKGSDAVAEMRRTGRQPSIGKVHDRGCEALQGSGDDIDLRRRHVGVANDGQQGPHHLSPAPAISPDQHRHRFGHGQTVKVQQKVPPLRRLKQYSKIQLPPISTGQSR